jgi:type IV pilus assembly protein PilW
MLACRKKDRAGEDMRKEQECNRTFNQKGFTLVEILISMVIGTIILAAVYVATLEGHRASTGIEQKISVQEDVRAALNIMVMEIGMASYNPTRATNNIWLNPACGVGVLAYKGIQTTAGFANNITVEMDRNGLNGISVGDPNEIITYSYDTANQRITRKTNCVGGGEPFIGDVVGAGTAAANRQRNVRVINNELGVNIFTYFDGTGTEITAANLPARIPDIRRIDITLAVVAADPDFQGQTRQMIHSTSVIPRNHAINYY